MTEQGRPDDDMTGHDPLADPMDEATADTDGVEPMAVAPGLADSKANGTMAPAGEASGGRTPATETPLPGQSKVARATLGASASKGTPSVEEGDQPRHVDDRASKWWVAIIIAVFALIFAWAVFLGGGGLLSDAFDEAEPTVEPSPSLAAGPSPLASVAASPTAEPTVAPTPEPTPQATILPASSPAG